MDVNAVVLNKLLESRDIEVWSRLKLAFLDPAFSSLYSAIARHYDSYGVIPSFEDLEVSLRDKPASRVLDIVKKAEAPEVDIDVALDAILDKYTQNEVVTELDRFVDKIPILSTTEIIEGISNIALKLDEKTLTTEGVYNMADICIFQQDEEIDRDRTYLGFNNLFDATLGGVARQELILIGGYRGSGKSICCSNIVASQYEAGFTSVYFSIEMIAKETFARKMSILSGVPNAAIKKNELSPEQVLSLVKTRAKMFVDADDLVEEFITNRDRFRFEDQLVKTKKLKPDNQIIIIDDRALTLSAFDLHLGKIKSRFGDKFRVAVLDYLNQIKVDTVNQFDWKDQIVISKSVKDLARKHDITIVSPYQIDASGEARFAKGILDAADIGLIMEAHDKETEAISFDTTKIRGDKEIHCTSGINWSTLRIDPVSKDRPQKSKKEDKVKRAGNSSTQEPASDSPW